MELRYEDGVKDTLKFLQDNSKIELLDMPTDQFVLLLRQLRGGK